MRADRQHLQANGLVSSNELTNTFDQQRDANHSAHQNICTSKVAPAQGTCSNVRIKGEAANANGQTASQHAINHQISLVRCMQVKKQSNAKKPQRATATDTS